ncbi:MAG: nucleoside kinase, partial [Prevotella sp.]|nr:nucleoside kinase [Prevotella sp.]
MLQIRCTNNNQTKSFPEGSSLLEIFPEFGLDFKYPVISAKVNNTSQGLKFRLWQNRDVEFVDIRNPSGMRAYIRSLCFVLYKAAQDVFPGCKLFIEHPLSRGYYCNFVRNFKNITANSPENKRGLTKEEVERVRQRMQEIIDLDMPFRRNESPTEEAIRIFKERGFIDKVRLLETSEKVYTDYYTLGDTVDYYYGSLVPSAGYLKVFGLEPYGEGMLLRVPDKDNPGQLAEMTPQPMTFDVYKEQVKWNVIMHLSNVGDVNKACQNGRAPELIQVSEALQEKKIVKIAEEIEQRYREQELKVVLITGPSSSGKTTFCKRLSIQLLACGLRPISFSTDDYFVNRADTPLLPNGQYDFDNFETVDHKLLGSHLVQLLEGKDVEVPEYNFTTGMREWNGKKLRIKDKHILIIEGIHALNPRLTENIPDLPLIRI